MVFDTETTGFYAGSDQMIEIGAVKIKNGMIIDSFSEFVKPNKRITDYITKLNLTDTISYVLGADDVKDGKPNPEPVNRTLKEFGIKPEEAIVVGDTVFDIQMGKNAGTRTCGVTYGNGSRESLKDADWIIEGFGQLLDILDNNFAQEA